MDLVEIFDDGHGLGQDRAIVQTQRRDEALNIHVQEFGQPVFAGTQILDDGCVR